MEAFCRILLIKAIAPISANLRKKLITTASINKNDYKTSEKYSIAENPEPINCSNILVHVLISTLS